MLSRIARRPALIVRMYTTNIPQPSVNPTSNKENVFKSAPWPEESYIPGSEYKMDTFSETAGKPEAKEKFDAKQSTTTQK
jgi:hypothetical protein